jgi:hypothetical protein
MVNGTFYTKLKSKEVIEIPVEVVAGLSLAEGDKIEVHLKKIKTRRMDIKISRNPLSQILEI